ncbi:MAG: hypothetical protein HQK87_01030 [Nitrospinae bacterium]|nr:hypothetical protein [Nitrospinota bacterium]
MNLKKLPVHLHHIGSHFTNGLFPVASVLLVMYFVTGDREMEAAAFYCALFGTLAIPLTYLSGGYDWRTRFQGRRTAIFTHKLIFGVLFFLLAAGAIALRVADPEAVAVGGGIGIAYASAVWLATGCATYLGHLGSKFI